MTNHRTALLAASMLAASSVHAPGNRPHKTRQDAPGDADQTQEAQTATEPANDAPEPAQPKTRQEKRLAERTAQRRAKMNRRQTR